MVYQSMEDLKRDYNKHVAKLFIAMELYDSYQTIFNDLVENDPAFAREQTKYYIKKEGFRLRTTINNDQANFLDCMESTLKGIERLKIKLIKIDTERIRWKKVDLIKIRTNSRADFTYERPNNSWY